MTASPSNSSNEHWELPLLLFALTAKLWVDRLNSNYRHQINGTNDTKHGTSETNEGYPIETDEERRTRRNLRLSIDSPDFIKHHFINENGNGSPLRRRCGRNQSNMPVIRSEHDADEEESIGERDMGSSMTFLHAECPRWRKLMERVSIADSVLTRDANMDFKTKNSNWSHFEGYESPQNENLPGDCRDLPNEDEEFLWSNPSQNDSLDVSTEYQQRYSDNSSINGSSKTEQSEVRDTNNSASTKSNKLPPQIHRRISSLETIRNYNATIMPNKLIMIRHGQSEGNVDEVLYSTKPDNNMRLTKLGWDTARMAGNALKEEIGKGETVHFVVSPYVRTVETFHGIVSAWVDPMELDWVEGRNRRLKAWYSKLMEMGLSWHEDPRIREQDFGNYQDPETIRKCKSERHKFGSFYYRFPHGESASDVFDRVSTFLDSLWRGFETQKAQNYVLVTHGISIRVFLARYFRYSIDQFNMLANPKNCDMIILKHDGLGRLQLDSRCEMEFEIDETDNNDDTHAIEGEPKKQPVTKVVGYAKHRRLKLLPPHLIQPRNVQMFYNDSGL